MFQVVKSDTDCEGSSESENQRENTAQTAQKKTAHTPRPDVIVEDQCSDQDELVRRVQNTALTETGTVMMCLQQLFQITINMGTVISSSNDSAYVWY